LKQKMPDAGQSMRQRLMEAAREEFVEKGFEAATTRKIAERAGCNEVSLFRHFESKQKLLTAVVQETSEEFRGLCGCQGKHSGNLLEDLETFARVYNNSFEKCEGMARTMIGESRRRPLLTKELIGDVIEPFHQSLARYLQTYQDKGLIRNDLNPMAFAEIFTSALMGGALRRTSGLSALDREVWIRDTVRIFVQGITVSGS